MRCSLPPSSAPRPLWPLAHTRSQRRSMLRLVSAGAAALVCVAAFALPSLIVHRQHGFERSEQLVKALSARPSDFLTRADFALLQMPPSSIDDTAGLFPGIVLSVLALLGAVLGVRDPRHRQWSLF